MGASWADHKSKNLSFWSIIFSYFTQQWTISWLNCDLWWKVDFIWQLAMTKSVAGLRRIYKAVLKAKFEPNKSHGLWWSAVSLIHYSFLNPSKTITSESLSKLVRCTKNCNTCSQRWSTERAQFFSMTMPDHISNNQYFKSWTNWATKFCLICHIHLTCCQLTTTSSSISTTFYRENTSITIRMQKMLSKSSSNPKVWIFMLHE